MDERRKSQRLRVLKSGKIVLSDKAPRVECTIRNLSDGGACLQIATTYGIPSAFELILGEGSRRACHVVWRTDTRMGVSFQPAMQDKPLAADKPVAAAEPAK